MDKLTQGLDVVAEAVGIRTESEGEPPAADNTTNAEAEAGDTPTADAKEGAKEGAKEEGQEETAKEGAAETDVGEDSKKPAEEAPAADGPTDKMDVDPAPVVEPSNDDDKMNVDPASTEDNAEKNKMDVDKEESNNKDGEEDDKKPFAEEEKGDTKESGETQAEDKPPSAAPDTPAASASTSEKSKVPDEYELGTIVYKNFLGEWYFGYVDHRDKETNYYHVRYEDNDQEDLTKRQMDDLVVVFDDGQIAKTTGVQKARKSRSSAKVLSKPSADQRTGTVDIIYNNPLYQELDGSKLSVFIVQRRRAYSEKLSKKFKKERDASAEAAAMATTPVKWEPKYELGTIVYKWFDSVDGYFFGYVARIDKARKQYCIQFEDGDTEDSNQTELQDIVVTLGDEEKVALTSKTPVEDEFDFNIEGHLDQVGTPGSLDILSHPSGMYSNLDKTQVEAFLAKHADIKKMILAEKAAVEEEKRMQRANKKARTARSFLDANGKLKQRVVDFYVFLHKRQKMWLRQKGASPYLRGKVFDAVRAPKRYPKNVLSSSDILLEYSFCNVYRELDRGTAYFHAHIVNIRETKDTWTELEWLEAVLWAALVYRLVNRVATFEALGGIPTKDEWKQFETKAHTYCNAESSVKFFTGAHQAPMGFAAFCRNFKSLSKSDDLQKLAEGAHVAADVSTVLKILSGLEGVGDFMSWQIVCDLRQSGCLEKFAKDKFCYLGPGAKKGLNQILVGRNEGNSNTLHASLEEAQELVELQDKAFESVSIEFPYWAGHKLTITEVEHGLCEFSKYCVYAGGKTNSKLRTYTPHPSRSGANVCVASKKEEKEGHFCDTCMAFRGKEYFTEQPKSWICARCNKFNSQFLVLSSQYSTKDYVNLEKEPMFDSDDDNEEEENKKETSKSEEKETSKPNENETSKPEETKTSEPEETETAKPEEAKTAKPEEKAETSNLEAPKPEDKGTVETSKKDEGGTETGSDDAKPGEEASAEKEPEAMETEETMVESDTATPMDVDEGKKE